MAVGRDSESLRASVKLTSGDRVQFPADGVTKGDVFAYYDARASKYCAGIRRSERDVVEELMRSMRWIAIDGVIARRAGDLGSPSRIICCQ